MNKAFSGSRAWYFYNKVIGELTKKKRKIQLIYKQMLITHYLEILSFSLVTNSGRYRRQGITNGGRIKSEAVPIGRSVFS